MGYSGLGPCALTLYCQFNNSLYRDGNISSYALVRRPLLILQLHGITSYKIHETATICLHPSLSINAYTQSNYTDILYHNSHVLILTYIKHVFQTHGTIPTQGERGVTKIYKVGIKVHFYSKL